MIEYVLAILVGLGFLVVSTGVHMDKIAITGVPLLGLSLLLHRGEFSAVFAVFLVVSLYIARRSVG